MSDSSNKRSKKQGIREIFKARSSSPENSPYLEWISRSGGTDGTTGEIQEPPEANPDVLPESALIRPPSCDSEALKAAIEAIQGGALDMLSAAQRRAFQLVVVEGQSEREAAETMGINRGTVRMYVRRAGRVLRAIIEGTKVPKCRPK